MDIELSNALIKTENDIQKCIDQANLKLLGSVIDSSSLILVSSLKLLEL